MCSLWYLVLRFVRARTAEPSGVRRFGSLADDRRFTRNLVGLHAPSNFTLEIDQSSPRCSLVANVPLPAAAAG